MIFLDFETRSKLDIKKVGAWKYAADPSTDVLCLAYAVKDLPVDLWLPGEEMPKDLKYYLNYGFQVCAHNAFFDRAVWRNIMVKRYDWPDIPDEKWSCSAALAAYYALPRSLEGVGAVLRLPVQKDTAGKRVMMKLSHPRTPTKSDSSEWHEDAEDYRALYRYCKEDVKAERAIVHRLRPLPSQEARIWALDQKINERGIRVDLDAVEAALRLVAAYEERLTKEFRGLTRGLIASPAQRDRVLAWLGSRGVKLPSLAKNDVLEALETKNGALPPDCRRVLEIRKDLSKTSTAKYQAVLESVCRDSRLRDLLMYHGASTGRWTGKLVQPQNFPRNALKGDLETCFKILKSEDLDTFELCYPDVMGTLSQIIRGIFIPSEGHTFFGGDYNAIEARVLFWLAGEEKGLEKFRKDEDIYKDLASDIYQSPASHITKAERDMGKRGVLGCGYGMGAEKFKLTCKAFARLDISDDLAERVINAYRNRYRAVVWYWGAQEVAAKEAIQTKRLVRTRNISWGVSDGFLFAKLPSGRTLAYFDPKIELLETPWGEKKDTVTYMSMNSVTKQWERTKTYGGKIVENLTQAVARDIMAEAMLRCEAAGYAVVLSVHDEILTERIETGKEKFALIHQFGTLMADKPAWADEIPIKVEAWTGKRYLK